MAIFEMIPIIIVIILLVNFSLGFFGTIHSGIMNSIAARNYAFSTFNHRANLTYFRNNQSERKDIHYEKIKLRFHGVTSEKKLNGENFTASTRPIDFFQSNSGKEAAETVADGSVTIHNEQIKTIVDSQRNQKVGANPVWIKVSYGICLDSNCGI